MRALLLVGIWISITTARAHDCLPPVSRPPPDLNSFILLRAPKSNTWIESVTYGNYIRGSLHAEYAGLHDIFWSQVERRIKDFNRRRLQLIFDHTNITEAELSHEYDRIESPTNVFGFWWERHWFESASPNRGGAPEPQVVVIGSQWDIPNRFRLIKVIQKRVESIWLDNDHIFQGIEDAKVQQTPVTRKPNTTTIEEERLLHKADLDVGYDPSPIESTSWFESQKYKVKIRPSIRFKSDYDTLGPIDEISFRAVVDLFMGPRNVHFLSVIIYVRYDVPKKNVLGTISIQLVNW